MTDYMMKWKETAAENIEFMKRKQNQKKQNQMNWKWTEIEKNELSMGAISFRIVHTWTPKYRRSSNFFVQMPLSPDLYYLHT